MNLLKELRGKKTQSQMAETFEVKQCTWSSWERGRTIPSPCVMQKLEDFFKVEKEKIFFTAFNYKM